MSGWVCSYRSIWKHPYFKGNGMRVAIWHWLLHHAAWKETPHKIGGSSITVKRGEVCFSQQQIQDETGASRKEVRGLIEWLISTGKASKIGANERANKGANVRANARTLLVIEKYEEYQSAPEDGANERANKGADEGPTKEQDKQINNSSIEESAPSAPGETIEISILSKAVWDTGKTYLERHQVKSGGALIGKWLKAHSAIDLLSALEAAQKSGTQDPVPYITKVLSGSGEEPATSLDEIMKMATQAKGSIHAQ